MGRLNLKNSKYLHKRKKIYYFVVKIGDTNLFKSLRTDNYTYANILKYKILYRLKEVGLKNNLVNDSLIYQKAGKGFIVLPETEEEEKIIQQIEDSARKKGDQLSKLHKNVISEDYEKRKVLTIEDCSIDFLEFKEQTTSSKTMLKYKQAVEYIYLYFGEKTKINSIGYEEASKFRNFLLKVPKNWKSKKELQGKLKLLIDKKSPLLDKYEKQSPANINEIIKRVKSAFVYFYDNRYTPENIFGTLKKLRVDNKMNREEFEPKEFKSLLKDILKENLEEDYNFCKFTLMTGLRRGEVLQLTQNDIDLEKEYIDTDRLKTEYSKRIIPIHKELRLTILKQLEKKSSEDYLFYNDYKHLKSREEKVGTQINKLILSTVGVERKKHLDIHSLRKNFTQELFFSNNFGDLELKTLVGHSTNNDITDKHYLRGKRDYKSLKTKLDQVDFSEYFDKDQVNFIKQDNSNIEINI